MQDVLLRPHHALCIRFFRGHGYSAEFTRNMRAVILRLEQGEPVRLVRGADSVCASCPNLLADGTTCRSEAHVRGFDDAVLGRLCLSPGQLQKTTGWKALCSLVDARILGPAGVFDSVCGDCQFAALCHA